MSGRRNRPPTLGMEHVDQPARLEAIAIGHMLKSPKLTKADFLEIEELVSIAEACSGTASLNEGYKLGFRIAQVSQPDSVEIVRTISQRIGGVAERGSRWLALAS